MATWLVALSLTILFVCTDPVLTTSELTYHRTPEWGHRYVRQDDGAYLLIESVLGPLQVRHQGQSGAALLLRCEEVLLPRREPESPSRAAYEAPKPLHIFDPETGSFRVTARPRRDAVYRYEPTARRLALVGDEAWEQAQGPVKECEPVFTAEDSQLLYDMRSHRLEFRGLPLDYAGNLLLNVAVTPSGKAAAVLSAAGWEGPNLFPFLGSPKVFGQRYHQVLSLENGQFAGAAIRLVSELGHPEVCWSPAEDFVVYLGLFGDGLSIAAIR